MSSRDLARLSQAAQKQTAVSGKPTRKRAARGLEGALPLPNRRGRAERRVYEGSEISIELAVAPQPKERARTFADERALVRAFLSAQGDVRRFIAAVKAKGANGEGGIMRSVTPDATRNFEEVVALMVRRAMADARMEPFSCPVEMEIEFRFEGDPEFWPTAHADGDLDNLIKSVKDAMNGVAYVDDRLMVRMTDIKVCALREGISLVLRPARP